MTVNVLHNLLVDSMSLVPRPVIWRFSRRYIAGAEIDDAYRTARELNELDCSATIDVLGEDSTNENQIAAAEQLYLTALQGIAAQALDCGVSIKLSEMGLRFEPALCREVMHRLVSRADKSGIFVRIDMEDSTVTSETLDIYRGLRREFDNVGAVIQSCLIRSESDVAKLLVDGPTNIRLCKGIYLEPEEISYRDPDDIRAAYKILLEQLFRGGAKQVAIATHDVELVRHAEDTIRRLGVSKDRYEFQMLLGVSGPLGKKLISDGHPVRVYVPFGELWFKYSMRRLRENPQILNHLVRNMFRR